MNEPTLIPRSNIVLEELNACHTNLIDKALYMSELLCEVRDSKYFVDYGFGRFDNWLEKSTFDIKPRQAYYLMAINDKSKKLGITKEELVKIGLSKLKAIFSIENPTLEQVKGLLEDAKTKSTDEITSQVTSLKLTDGQEPFVYITLKLPQSAKDGIDEAVELARKHIGGASDAPVGVCIEWICANFLLDPNFQAVPSAEIQAQSTGLFEPETVQDLNNENIQPRPVEVPSSNLQEQG